MNGIFEGDQIRVHKMYETHWNDTICLLKWISRVSHNVCDR